MRLVISLATLALVACGGDDDTGGTGGNGGADAGAGGAGGGATIDEPETYSFESRFTAGSSVSYSGQTKRHVLVSELKAYLGSLDDETFADPQQGDITGALLLYVDFADVGFGEYEITLSGPAPLKQGTIADLGDLADLRAKMPDQDAGWQGGVVGYGDGTMSPTAALEDMFQKVEDLVIQRFQGEIPQDPNGNDIALPFLSANGVDYQQLVQKYLAGAIFYSQGLDDYLDDDLEGKGLLSDNTAAVVSGDETKPYTGLEHVWDEGFGYFGAARDYDQYTDDEIAISGGREDWQGAHDSDGDGAIDLKSEFVFGHAQNAAKRDRGSKSGTDFTQQAFDAFVRGRTLIVNAGGALSSAQMDALKAERDTIAKAWEDAIAATVVHYINDVMQDMSTFGSDDYDFASHAKHWSELKGFALALQFNVNHSSWSPADYARLMTTLGDAPVLPSADQAEIDGYWAALREARTLVGQTQGFAAEDLGDEMGLNGW